MPKPSLMITPHGFRYWSGALKQQAITWVKGKPDIYRHMASLDNNEISQFEI